jgi:hypothetical protein
VLVFRDRTVLRSYRSRNQWQAQLEPHDSQDHQTFAHRETFADGCGAAVICVGSMRKLSDRRGIRKRRSEIDPDLDDGRMNRDSGHSPRARKRRSSTEIELDGEDEPCRSIAWRRFVGEFGKGGEAGEVWKKRGGFGPQPGPMKKTAGSRRSIWFAQGCVHASGQCERTSITRATAASGGGSPTPIRRPGRPIRSRSSAQGCEAE